MKLVGYHATFENPLNIIDNQGNLRKRTPPPAHLPGDLGTGTYFFKDDCQLAYQFLEKNCQNDQSIKIIKCQIEANVENILDFNSKEHQEMFKKFKKIKFDQAKKTFSKLKGNRKCIDGIIINLLIQAIKAKQNVDIQLVIKDTFTPTLEWKVEKGFLHSNFSNGTELCVRDPSIVKKGVILNGV